MCKMDPNICEVWGHRNKMKIEKSSITKKNCLTFYVKNLKVGLQGGGGLAGHWAGTVLWILSDYIYEGVF